MPPTKVIYETPTKFINLNKKVIIIKFDVNILKFNMLK